MKVEKLAVRDLNILTELFQYHDVEQMIMQCTREIQNGVIDIFVLYDRGVLIGELRARYESDDANDTIRGKRAYLYAFRIRAGFQNRGYGTYLLKTVLSVLERNGYDEFTVGVEDDNERALHIYQKLGFHEFLLRKREEYQGDSYEYNLYRMKLSNEHLPAN